MCIPVCPFHEVCTQLKLQNILFCYGMSMGCFYLQTQWAPFVQKHSDLQSNPKECTENIGKKSTFIIKDNFLQHNKEQGIDCSILLKYKKIKD